MPGTRQGTIAREVVAIAASTTLSNYDLGKTFTNRGATGSVTITLPTPSGDNAGGEIRVRVLADQTVVVNCATNDKIVIINDAAADSVAWQTSSEKIGGGGMFESDGTNWYFSALNAGANTVTTAT
jgi:hypothetical protein